MERNPYYWKVDPNGNQLPYIDAIIHELHAEAQSIVLKAVGAKLICRAAFSEGCLTRHYFSRISRE